MSDRSEAEISEAIQECAKECAGKSDPPARVLEFCDRLVSEHSGLRGDAAIVKDGTLRVIDHLGQLLF